MKKLRVSLFVVVVCVSFVFAGNSFASVETYPANSLGQVVPTTKRVSRKVYRKGRWVTVTTYKHGKKITKKVWKKGNHYGHKTAGKTKEIIMGPKKTP